MPANHKKAMEAIVGCRTAACGITVCDCEQCGETHHFYRSCGNRHCPSCQHQKALQWMGRQLEKALPGHHFMATFTVPEEIRSFIRSHQKAAYGAMFKASSETLKKLSLDESYIGGDAPGFFGVLHTWGRTLRFHPHIHYVLPGGAFPTEDGQWHPSRIDFYPPVRAMSKIYKAKCKSNAIRWIYLFNIHFERYLFLVNICDNFYLFDKRNIRVSVKDCVSFHKFVG